MNKMKHMDLLTIADSFWKGEEWVAVVHVLKKIR